LKTYKNLWDTLISYENVLLAIKNSSKRKRDRESVQKILDDPDTFYPIIVEYAEAYEPKEHTAIIIFEPTTKKERKLYIPTYMELIIQHMLIQAIMPVLMSQMYELSYASIPGRGQHKCAKKIKQWIKEDPRHVKYCVKMDIHHFFDSIDQDILYEKLATKIKDAKVLRLIKAILGTIDHGLPLGFFTSQWFANFYMQDFDHWIKEVCGVTHYARFMDDMALFDSNKYKLHNVLYNIQDYVKDNLHLELKHNYQLFRFDYIQNGVHYGRDLDFIGFRFFRDRTELRKSTMLRFTRRAMTINKNHRIRLIDARAIESYMGNLNHCDIYYMVKGFVEPYVDIELCHSKISENDKYKNFKKKLKNIKKDDPEFYNYIYELIHENDLEYLEI
jgi:retron-type reverse transcriptase